MTPRAALGNLLNIALFNRSNESDTFKDHRIEFRPLRFLKLTASFVSTKPLHWYFKHIQLYLHKSNGQRKYANEHEWARRETNNV